VLYLDRPWDVQKGTADETYNRMAMAIKDDFIWDRTCPKQLDGSVDPTNSIGALNIIGQWQNQAFGNLASRGVLYGRAAWSLDRGGFSYPTTTAGEKRVSIEVSGQFFNTQIT
jgi:hypothetical protein